MLCQLIMCLVFLSSKKLKMMMKKVFPLVDFSYNNLSEYGTCKNYSYVCDIEITGLGLYKYRMIISL